MKDMQDHLDGKVDTYETTYRIKNKAGKYVKFFDRGKIIGERGDEVIVAGFVFDYEQYKRLMSGNSQ